MVLKIAYIVVAIISLVPFLGQYIADAYRILLGIGFILIVYDCFTQRRILHNRYAPLILGFLLIIAISIFMNYDKSLVGNVKVFAYMSMPFLVFTAIDLQKPKDKTQKEIGIISYIIVFMVFFIALSSLITFIFGY